MKGTPKTESKSKNNSSQHWKGHESTPDWVRDRLLPSRASSLQGPDGFSLPWEIGLGFACHQQSIQNSDRTLTLSPGPINLASQAVKVIMAFVYVSSIPGSNYVLRVMGMCRLTMFENGNEVGEYL